MILSRTFFDRNPIIVARELLGKKIVRNLEGELLCGMISETEAYTGAEDTACHASKGKTERNAVMFGPPGHAYVYFIYGMYNMLNLVTESDNPSAVLIRGLIPLDGIETMKRLRGRNTGLTDGPGKLSMALSVDRSLNGVDVTRRGPLWVEEYREIPDGHVRITPRIGIDYAEPEDRDAPYRYRITEPADIQPSIR